MKKLFGIIVAVAVVGIFAFDTYEDFVKSNYLMNLPPVAVAILIAILFGVFYGVIAHHYPERVKKWKETIARFFWNRGITPRSINIIFAFIFAGAGVLAIGLFLLMKAVLWGVPIAILGIASMLLPMMITSWQVELPEYKLDKAVKCAEALLKNCPPQFIEKGTILVRKAKATGNADQLEKWADTLADYMGTKDELHELKKQIVDIPKEIRELKQNLADLRQSLENV